MKSSSYSQITVRKRSRQLPDTQFRLLGSTLLSSPFEFQRVAPTRWHSSPPQSVARIATAGTHGSVYLWVHAMAGCASLLPAAVGANLALELLALALAQMAPI